MKITSDLAFKISKWSLTGHTGMSSSTIAAVALGLDDSLRHGASHPHDPADFSLCYKLLKEIPELYEVLPEVSAKYPLWTNLVNDWHNFEEIYELDVASEGSRELYREMQYAITSAEIDSGLHRSLRATSLIDSKWHDDPLQKEALESKKKELNEKLNNTNFVMHVGTDRVHQSSRMSESSRSAYRKFADFCAINGNKVAIVTPAAFGKVSSNGIDIDPDLKFKANGVTNVVTIIDYPGSFSVSGQELFVKNAHQHTESARLDFNEVKLSNKVKP